MPLYEIRLKVTVNAEAFLVEEAGDPDSVNVNPKWFSVDDWLEIHEAIQSALSEDRISIVLDKVTQLPDDEE